MILKSCHRSFAEHLKVKTSNSLFKLYQYCMVSTTNAEIACDLLVVGGGAGGCSVAAKFTRQLKKNKVVIVEPNDRHYYQPMFTMIGGGVKKLEEAVRPMKDVLPSDAVWLQDRVSRFDPDNNLVYTWENTIVNYKYMVVSCGVELDFHSIPGLVEALDMEDSGVCSIYSPKFVEKTFKTLKNLRIGNAVFTFPNSPVKCAGAPLKVCFLAEDYTRLHKRREDITFMYQTSQPVIFAVKHYADTLLELCGKRHIKFDLRRELIAVKPEKKEAMFRNLDKTYEVITVPYTMLHVTPPMNTPIELKKASLLVDRAGYLNVDKCTLQHIIYKNIFGLGDCTNLPTSKTAAAVSVQGNVLHRNLTMVMNGRPIEKVYNGYTSCPLVTSYGKCILAEFDYEKNPLETFPIDQRKELALTYYIKRDILPQIYWWCMKGFWNGPDTFRKLCHLGFTGY